MDAEKANRLIADAAQDILLRMYGTTIYGHPIDIGNTNHLIIAAYEMGRREYRERLERRDWQIIGLDYTKGGGDGR